MQEMIGFYNNYWNDLDCMTREKYIYIMIRNSFKTKKCKTKTLNQTKRKHKKKREKKIQSGYVEIDTFEYS